jgi:hypothetical protein
MNEIFNIGDMIEKLNIDASQTPEKFRYLTNEVLEFLVGKLLIIDQLEQEIYERYEVIQTLRTSPNQAHPGEKGLWEEYAQRCKAIIAPISIKPYNDSRSLGKPTAYEYLNYPDTKIIFIMKSANRAVIETQYEYGIGKKEKFVLKKDENGWKIDTKKYGFSGEDTWWKDNL